MAVTRGVLLLSAIALGGFVMSSSEASATCPYRSGKCDGRGIWYNGQWNNYCPPGATPRPGYLPMCYRPPAEPVPFMAPAGMSTPGAFLRSAERSKPGTDSSVLLVKVPAAARVFVNGKLTKISGETRRFALTGLIAGATYKYDVRVELPDAEHPVSESQTVVLSAGQEQQLTFDFEAETGANANVAAKPAASTR